MKHLAIQLGLDEDVEFGGWADDSRILSVLSTADVCLAPDPKSPLNDRSTMIKVIEYMAMGRAIVSFDLAESRVTAGEAALYAPANDESAFADRIEQLLDHPELRMRSVSPAVLASRGRSHGVIRRPLFSQRIAVL